MSTPDALRQFWDRRYEAVADHVYGRSPNDFLVRESGRIAPGGAVLSLADGEGRNSVWLARRGHAVTAVDVSEAGLRKARALADLAAVRIETLAADVTTLDLGEHRWDAIVSIFLHLPPGPRLDLHRRCLQALKPGGVYLFEAYGHGQLHRDTGGPKEPHLLPRLADVEAELSGGVIEHRFEGLREVNEGVLHRGTGSVVQLAVRRPEDPAPAASPPS